MCMCTPPPPKFKLQHFSHAHTCVKLPHICLLKAYTVQRLLRSLLTECLHTTQQTTRHSAARHGMTQRDKVDAVLVCGSSGWVNQTTHLVNSHLPTHTHWAAPNEASTTPATQDRSDQPSNIQTLSTEPASRADVAVPVNLKKPNSNKKPTLSSGSPNSPMQGRSMRPMRPKMYLNRGVSTRQHNTARHPNKQSPGTSTPGQVNKLCAAGA